MKMIIDAEESTMNQEQQPRTYEYLQDVYRWTDVLRRVAEDGVCARNAGGVLPNELDAKMPTRELREAVVTEVLRAAGVGAVIGYALAKTWPASADELDGWIERALELAFSSLRDAPPA